MTPPGPENFLILTLVTLLLAGCNPTSPSMTMHWTSASFDLADPTAHDDATLDLIEIRVINPSDVPLKVYVFKDRRGGEGPFQLESPGGIITYGRSSGPAFMEVLPGDSLLIEMTSYDPLTKTEMEARKRAWQEGKLVYRPGGGFQTSGVYAVEQEVEKENLSHP